MGNTLSSQRSEDKRALTRALQERDVPAATAIVAGNVSLLLSRLDRATGNTAIHLAASTGDHASLTALTDAVNRCGILESGRQYDMRSRPCVAERLQGRSKQPGSGKVLTHRRPSQGTRGLRSLQGAGS